MANIKEPPKADDKLAPWKQSEKGGTFIQATMSEKELRKAEAYLRQAAQYCPPPTDPNGRTRINEVVGTRLMEPVRSGDTQKVPMIKESWYQANRGEMRLYALVLGAAVPIGVALGILIQYFR